VVQKHAARRLHWDLRLEFDGVLRSWAVPHGPSLDPDTKRLAVLTEDHPIEYRDYEGVIPEGNYGAGAMIVWDRGTYVPMEKKGEGFDEGKLLFELRGYKLRGVWTLVRTKRGEGKEWLLIKKPDGAAAEGEPAFDERSVLSGLTIEEMASGSDRAERILELASAAPHTKSGASFEPMLCEVRSDPFDDEKWLFELKYDGYRLIAKRAGDQVTLRYRSGRSATDAFPDVVTTLSALPFDDFVLDGEVVVLDDDGRPNFQRLQKRAKFNRSRDVDRAVLDHPATYYAFDLLAFGELDLRTLPLVHRKQALTEMLPGAGPVRLADHIPARGTALFDQVRQLDLEGIVGKRGDSEYRAGRSPHWLKIRVDRSDDFVIVGYRHPKGSRTGVGSLLVASHVGPTLTYLGRVGSGMSVDLLNALRDVLDSIRRDTPPCAGDLPRSDADTWVEPRLVCEVRFREITEALQLRQPVFLRMREDKSPDECELRDEPGKITDRPEDDVAEGTDGEQRNVVISNPDKVFWPEQGYTKLDLIDYYRAVSPWLLPYLRDRPIVLTRYPDGIEGKSFFQKNAPPYVPDWLTTKTVWSEHAKREIAYFVCNDIESLTYIANMGAIPLHVWASRIHDLQKPDWCVLDLDPKGAPFPDVVRIALEIKSLCDEIDLPSFCKTSGSTGLHVFLPLGGQCTHEQSRMLAQILARVVSERLRDIATIARSLERRDGKVYIDFGQNGHGRLIASPFSARPVTAASVSTPLRWEEVNDELDISTFTIKNVPERFRALQADPMADVMALQIDLHAVLGRLAEMLDE
jgi:bifunctional non-homologous end joining protein LigD